MFTMEEGMIFVGSPTVDGVAVSFIIFSLLLIAAAALSHFRS